MRNDENISLKTNRVLNLFLLALILIFVRVWFLSVIQREDQLQLSQKPRRRSVIEKTERGTIRDRYNIPIAENKICYSAAVSYADIKEIPSYVWQSQKDGKKIKIPKRKEHIGQISKLLADALGMDPESIEDTIYGKAALFPQMPFIIKDEISEEEYFKLKMLEKDFLGIRTQKSYKRIYPLGKIGCEIIGYMGSISDKEYRNITSQIAELEHYIQERENGNTPILPKGFADPNAVRTHLKYLKERAYTLQDFIGKSGVEARFDKELRGAYGKSFYEVDTKGNILRKLPGSKDPSPARRIMLTISAELQEFAEKLLAERERYRSNTFHQKGGAIVAMDPKNGEILALASYPRFSPQDFIPSSKIEEKILKTKSVSRWLETENYLGQIWDGSRKLEKELYDPVKGFYEVSRLLNWQQYLKTILSEKSSLYKAMQQVSTLKDAWVLQTTFEKIQELLAFKDAKEVMHTLYELNYPSRQEETFSEEYRFLKKELDYYLSTISHINDKLLAIDLAKLLVGKNRWSEEGIESFGTFSLNEYNLHRQVVINIEKGIENRLRDFFHVHIFHKWREAHFKEFLKTKRKEEEAKKTYAKPYTDYLEAEEKKQFKNFWKSHRYSFLCAFLFDEIVLSSHLKEYEPFLSELKIKNWQKENKDLLNAVLSPFTIFEKCHYVQSMKSFDTLIDPLLCKYGNLRNEKGKQLQKHLAEAFYPLSGYGYVRSSAFRQEIPQGSVFKLVVAYEALMERFAKIKESFQQKMNLNPLTLIDDLKWASTNASSQILGYTLEGEPITRVYKGGKLPRSSHSNIGKVDLIGAIEQSSNIYFSILASEYIQSPSTLLDITRKLGLGNKTMIDLPGEIEGNLPEDINYNKTGLYAFAIGQHSLVVTPLQTAVMMSAIANSGNVLKPQIVKIMAAREKNENKSPLEYTPDFAYEETLSLAGIYFPLFTEALPLAPEPVFETSLAEIRNHIDLPKEVRQLLLKGMQQVMLGPKGTAKASSIRALCHSEKMFKDYVSLQELLVGKTGTAELLIKPTIEAESAPYIQNHIWFSGISFESSSGKMEKWDDPDLVIVVYLPNGASGGKEAAPIAAQVVKKWKEIKKKNADL